MLWPVLIQAQEKAFYQEIAAFKRADSAAKPEKNAILFIGSSSIRLWKTLQQDFPGYTIINRGFGGSTLTDLIGYADDIIFPYEPRQIVVYCGENDLAASDTVTVQVVMERIKKLFLLIRSRLQTVPVTFISFKPSPSREKLLDKVKETNKCIKKYLRNKPNTSFIDVFSLMTDRNGAINQKLFIEDKLHMNIQGYKIWQKAIIPYLLKD